MAEDRRRKDEETTVDRSKDGEKRGRRTEER